MQLGMISTSDANPMPRLGVRMGAGRVLDVARAARVSGGEAFLSLSPSVREHLANREAEAGPLAQLVDRYCGVAPEASGGAVLPEAGVAVHPPIADAEKFICVGKNYRGHLDELARADLIREVPEEPTGFVKLNAVLSGQGARVARPRGIVNLDYEPELAFVIGAPARRVAREAAFEHVYGVTLFNDLTAREIQHREVQSGTRFWTSKNMPGFGPLGPWIVSRDEIGDIDNLTIECRVNGERRMSFSTRDQIFKAPDIVEHFSRYLPLRPGDLFATGSAPGVAVGQENAETLFLRPGDVVEVVLEGIMCLSTTIVEEDAPA